MSDLMGGNQIRFSIYEQITAKNRQERGGFLNEMDVVVP